MWQKKIAIRKISNLNNVQDLYNERDLGISGVIIGKAIDENKININDLTKFSWN